VTVATVEYPLGDPAFSADPYPTWDALRAHGPISYWPVADAHIAIGYDAVRDALASPDLSPSRRFHRHYTEPDDDILIRLEAAALFHLGPGDHTRVRRLVTSAFTPASIDALRPRIDARARRIVDQLAVDGGGDLADRTGSYPIEVIGDYLGLDPELAIWFRDHTPAVFALSDPFADTERRQAAAATLTDMEARLRDEFDRRRGHEPVDLLGRLVAAGDTGDRLSSDEMFALVVALLMAGAETTSNLLTLGTWALLTHPDQRDLLVTNPDLLGGAIEEMLRWSYIGTGIARFAIRDTTVAGVDLTAGDLMFCSIGAALRDPAHVEQPERFDITRAAGSTLAFGIGAHYCIGAALARAEAAAIFGALLATTPRLEISGPVEFSPHPLLRGITSLPVAT
jgi:cytochrome P450